MSHPKDHSALLSRETTDVIMSDKTPNKVIKVGKCLSSEESKEYYDLLHQFPDIFSWCCEEIPGIHESNVVHKIILSPDAKPMK